MPDGSPPPHSAQPRPLPHDMAERLIVALDVESVEAASDLVTRLQGTVSFFKIGLWLQFAPGVDGLIDRLIDTGNQVFLDAKMFDIPETVSRAVAVAARRRVSFITVHGDEKIIRAAVESKGDSALKIFAVTVLTSLGDAELYEMGYRLGARDLVQLRATNAAELGCDGIIASANDDPDAIRRLVRNDSLLIATPGVRLPGAIVNDHKRVADPAQAIANGADYLVVGRPIIQDADPVAAARLFIAQMQEGKRSREAA